METLTSACRTDGCERQHQAAGSWCPACGLPNDPAPELGRTAAGVPPTRAGTGGGGASGVGFLLSLRGQESAVMALAVVVVLAAVVVFATRGMLGFGSPDTLEEYGYQRSYADQVGDGGDVVAPQTQVPETTEWAPSTEPETTAEPSTTVGDPAELARDALAVASATAPDSVDDAGNPTSYGAEHVLDEDPTTAWRVEGDGSGATITVTLSGPARLTQVGLIPGYAKTDATSGVDRFAQERRIV